MPWIDLVDLTSRNIIGDILMVLPEKQNKSILYHWIDFHIVFDHWFDYFKDETEKE